jgi:hypothetical protein
MAKKIVMRGQLAFFWEIQINIFISRKTTDSYRIEKSYPTLMGHSNPVYS